MSRPFKVVCVSGYFDPLHRGHVEYIENARKLGDKLIVILNSDAQRTAVPRTALDDRRYILERLQSVDEVVVSVDVSPHVCETLKRLKPAVFAKGLIASEKELQVCCEEGIEVVTNVGQQLHFHDLMASLR